MKAILEFNLDDPDDRDEHQLCLDAFKYQRFMEDFSEQVLRKLRKYGCKDTVEEYVEHEENQFRQDNGDPDLVLTERDIYIAYYNYSND